MGSGLWLPGKENPEPVVIERHLSTIHEGRGSRAPFGHLLAVCLLDAQMERARLRGEAAWLWRSVAAYRGLAA
jgi:hypothetical protein